MNVISYAKQRLDKNNGIHEFIIYYIAGVVESTENIYKYHMQLQPNSTTSNGSGARTPPQPSVQTPVGAGSQGHSRSSSHSSLQSGKNLQSSTITSAIQSPTQLTLPPLVSKEKPCELKS